MSFSTEVKQELASLKQPNACDKAELSGLFHIGGSLEIVDRHMRLLFQTTNKAVARKIMGLVKQVFSVDMDIISKKQLKLSKHDLYILKVDDHVDDIIDVLSLADKNATFFQDVDASLVDDEACKRAYLRGAFLAGGSINNPSTATYHLEIQAFSDKQAEILADLMNAFNLHAKTAKNKRGTIAYLKEAERIADFLRVIGATNSLFSFEDSRIKRDFKNSINRVINCDIANERKALAAAKRQLRDIRTIEKHPHLTLTKSDREAIFLRKHHPDASLHELSEASETHFDKKISKSALNHRFRKLKEIADKVRRHD